MLHKAKKKSELYLYRNSNVKQCNCKVGKSNAMIMTLLSGTARRFVFRRIKMGEQPTRLLHNRRKRLRNKPVHTHTQTRGARWNTQLYYVKRYVTNWRKVREFPFAIGQLTTQPIHSFLKERKRKTSAHFFKTPSPWLWTGTGSAGQFSRTIQKKVKTHRYTCVMK